MKKVNIIICHSDPLSNIGGTEKYINSKIKYYKNLSTDSLVVYIQKIKRKDRSFLGKKYNYGININHQKFVEKVDIKTLVKKLQDLTINKEIKLFLVESIVSWLNDKRSLKYIFNYIKKLPGQKHISFHDTLFICSDIVVYPRKNNNYTKNYSLKNSAKCYFCKSSWVINFYNKIFFLKFLNLVDKINIPSDFIRDLFIEKYGKKFNDKLIVKEHVKKTKTNLRSNSKIKNKNAKIKIAYLGNISDIKGMNEFIKLANDNNLSKNYEFYSIGRDFKDKNIASIVIDYNSQQQETITGSIVSDLLYKKSINIVFLFSKVAESYSYTMHEADCSAIPIVSSNFSGNISYQIKSGNVYGICFENYDEICNFLIGKDKVINFINNNNKVLIDFMKDNNE